MRNGEKGINQIYNTMVIQMQSLRELEIESGKEMYPESLRRSNPIHSLSNFYSKHFINKEAKRFIFIIIVLL